MPLEAAVRQIRDVALIDLNGRITLGDGCELLRQTVRNLLDQGQRNLLVNLENVSYVDSAGLGELVGSHVTVSRAGGVIKLLNAQNKISDRLQITKLTTIFETYDNQNLAVLSFDSPQGAAAS